MTWMLKLYPRAWRERYGDEVEAYLDSEPVGFRTALDLLLGAIDARMNPQPITTSSATEGKSMLSRIIACERKSYYDGKQGAVWMIGISLAAVLLAGGMQIRFGPSEFTQGLLNAAFPIALWITSFQASAGRRHSRASRIVLAVVVSGLIYAAFLGIARLGDLI